MVCTDLELNERASVSRSSGTAKVIFTLNIDNYSPEITSLTYPLLKAYARKINAEFLVISERKFHGWPPVYEKLQIYDLAREYGAGWFIYLDSDALVHPDSFDITNHLRPDTVCHNGKDMAGNRWRYDQYFRRDGRHIGSCNWFAIASDLCLDLWRPLDDLSLEEAVENIFPIVGELNGTVTRDHLIDDYTLSRNIAKFGLKHTTVIDICRQVGFDAAGFFWHLYNIPEAEKVERMKAVLKQWGLMRSV